MLHPSGSAAMSTLLWLVAVSLMVAEGGDQTTPDGTLARWSILVALVATCCTVSALINHARRVVLDVVSFEHQTTRAGGFGGAGRADSRVVPIRRGVR